MGSEVDFVVCCDYDTKAKGPYAACQGGCIKLAVECIENSAGEYDVG